MSKLVFIFFLFNMSCNLGTSEGDSVKNPTNSKVVRLKLSEELGEMAFSIPVRYDTSFNWVHYSDCGKPCDKKKYRFQPKNFPIEKESGWIWNSNSDSVDQFTISYSMDVFLRNDDTTPNPEIHSFIKERLLLQPENDQLNLETLEKINGRYFSIFIIGESNGNKTKKAFAITTIKGNEVTFLYEQKGHTNNQRQDDFIKQSIDYFKTIKVIKETSSAAL